MDLLHDKIMENIARLQDESDEAHKERMKAWAYLQTEEYSQEVRNELVGLTHPDITPPWLDDEEEQ